MKVLHITNNYPTKKHPIFGIFVKEQIDSLSELGIENEVFFINGRERGKTEYLMSILKLRKLLNKKKFDVIHCHHAFSAVCFVLTGHYKRNKSIVSYQNDPSNEQGNKLFEFVRKKVDAIILKNNSTIVNNISIFSQPNGVNTNLFLPIERKKCLVKLNLNPSKKYVLFVSSNFIREQKRYDRFQKTLEIVKYKYGVKDLEELKLINTKRELVPYFFNAASLHLLSSDFEGSPNSVKEAMACNIPVVSTDVGNVQELLNGVNGSYVAKSNNAEDLAAFVVKALNNKEPLNSRNILIQKQLDIESVAKKIISIYNKFINNKQAYNLDSCQI